MSWMRRLDDIVSEGKGASVITGDDLGYFAEWRLRRAGCRATFQDDGFEAFVVQASFGGPARLVWHDRVANVWAEDLPTLGFALLRLAHLIEAVTLDKGTMGMGAWFKMASGWADG